MARTLENPSQRDTCLSAHGEVVANSPLAAMEGPFGACTPYPHRYQQATRPNPHLFNEVLSLSASFVSICLRQHYSHLRRRNLQPRGVVLFRGAQNSAISERSYLLTRLSLCFQADHIQLPMQRCIPVTAKMLLHRPQDPITSPIQVKGKHLRRSQ